MLKKDYKTLFLRQSYFDSTMHFNELLNNSETMSQKTWDYVALTASNEKQAESYRLQIDMRLSRGSIPPQTKYIVVPDINGKRVGSGGATLSVIREIAKIEKNPDFSKLKILCIHSGGDSKRVPQYSVCGKIFSPIPRTLDNGELSTLFDEIMISVSGIPNRINSGMLVCSGDVLVLYNSLQLDYCDDGAIALSVKEDVSLGERHGVFLSDNNGFVRRCFQKQSKDILDKFGAVSEENTLDIDSGEVILSSKIVNALYLLIKDDDQFQRIVNEKTNLSFYVDLLYPLTKESSLEEFYSEPKEGLSFEEVLFARKKIWEALHMFDLKLAKFSPAAFLHFGTTLEVLKLLTTNIENYKFLGWSKNINSNYKGDNFAVRNSLISRNAKIGRGSYIENSEIRDNVIIGEGTIISGAVLQNIVVPSNLVLNCVQLKNGKFVCRIYGVNDNPKENSYIGETINEALWTKPLFKTANTMEEAIKNSINKKMDGELLSLRESFEMANSIAQIKYEENLKEKILSSFILESIEGGMSLENLRKYFPNGISEQTKNYILNELSKNAITFSTKIRAYYYIAKLAKEVKLVDDCFSEIKNQVIKTTLINQYNIECLSKNIKRNSVTVKLPVRVNWGGGWSDTPPYCLEKGGTVLNAAIKLNGELPIEVNIEKTSSYCFELASTDIGVYQQFNEVRELFDCSNPSDPFSLHKAALFACGIVSHDKNKTIKEICESIGGGLYINTRVVNIPKGSGLGTSSILAAACVKAIGEFFGLNYSDDEIILKVLQIEQFMSTGGGWQDQVRGIKKGIKLITSEKFNPQKIVSTSVILPENIISELNDRMALIYTGQRRLARNLLREIVGKYIMGDKDVIDSLESIQQIAVLMKFELERGNVDGFAQLLNKHWELSKKIDAGCTNTCIDQIIMAVEDLIDGKMICGAGGGGFIQVILKKNVSKEMLKTRLKEIFADCGVIVYNSELYFGEDK